MEQFLVMQVEHEAEMQIRLGAISTIRLVLGSVILHMDNGEKIEFTGRQARQFMACIATQRQLLDVAWLADQPDDEPLADSNGNQ